MLHLKHKLFLRVKVIFCLFVCAQINPVHAAPSGLSFSVKPKLCVLAESEEHCASKIEFRWRSDELRSVCLFQDNKRLPLRCWEAELAGSHVVDVLTEENIDYELREIDGDTLLLAESFEVIQNQKKFRKRRRNPWSFF
jgi:hypothetical protein